MAFNDILKSAIEEAVKWQDQLTESERAEISFSEARQRACDRIFERHKVTEFVLKNTSTERKICDCQLAKYNTAQALCHGMCQY